MRTALGFLFIILGLFAVKNFAFAQQEAIACYRFLYTQDYKNAIEVGKRTIKKYPKNANAHYCLSLAYLSVGELKLALEHAKKAERLTSKKTDLLLIYNQIGLIYLTMGLQDEALPYLNKSLNLAKELGIREAQASLLNNIGLIHSSKGELNKASSYFEDVLRLDINEVAKAQTYNNIAAIYRTKGDYRKAVEYLQRTIEISERYGYYREASFTKMNLGDTYREMKNYEKAERYILDGFEGVKKVGDKLSEAVGYIFLGWLYKDKKDYEKAERYLLDGLEGVKKANAKPFEAIAYLLLGSIYKDKKNYELAEKYLLDGIALAKQVGNKLSETLGYRYIGLLYKDRGNKDTAKEYLTRAYNLYKSMGAEVYAQEVFMELQELEKGAENLTTSQPEVEACFNFHKSGDYKKAVEAGKEAVKKYPNNFKAHYCLGLNYRVLGELKLALEHMKKAESLTSNKRDLMHIYNEIGLIYKKWATWTMHFFTIAKV
jgi:tetratricopeptide (TPR) repeat protein